MEHVQKYERQYFMPPVCEYDWVKKDYIDKATDLVFRRLKRRKPGIDRTNELRRKTGIFRDVSR